MTVSGIDPVTAGRLASVVLDLHLAAAGFVVFGLAAIPIGAALRWPFAHSFAWRIAHLTVVAVIAAQKAFGRTCFLSIWEERLLAQARVGSYHPTLVDRAGDAVIHVGVPMPALIIVYATIFFYTLWLWRVVPPRLLGARRR